METLDESKQKNDMRNFFGKPREKIFDLANLSSDLLLYRVVPRMLLEIARKYFRLNVQGIEHLPKHGRALIVPNHSGYSGFDAMLTGYEINKATRRVARVLTHPFWFLTPTTALPAHKLGFEKASMKNGNALLKRNNMVMIFPEGEKGNFKPTSQAYQLRRFKTGFVRLSILNQAPIIPTLVIGAEETHINLSQLKFTRFLSGTIIPIPLNILPLPAKWRIKFLEPIYLPYQPEAAEDHELMEELAQEIRERMQEALNKELSSRDYIYFDNWI